MIVAFYKQEKPDPICSEWAERLAAAILKSKRTISKHYATNWPLSFAKLKKVIREEVITKTLNWYCEHIGQEYVPVVLSAETFRLRFDAIAQAMDRQDMSGTDDVPVAIKALITRYENEPLPPEIKVKLPYIITRSWKNWDEFQNKMRRVAAILQGDVPFHSLPYSSDANARDAIFLHHVMDHYSPGILDRYIHGICFRYGRMESYGGNVSALVLDTYGERFKSIWQGWSDSFTNAPSHFDHLLKKLLEEK